MNLLVGLVGSAWCFCSYGSSRLPGHVLLMVIAETYEGKVNTPSTHQTFACIISTTMPVAKVSQPKVIVWGDTLQELRHIILPSLTSGEQKSKLFPWEYVGGLGNWREWIFTGNTLIYIQPPVAMKSTTCKWNTGHGDERCQPKFHIIHHPLHQCVRVGW